MTIDISNNNPRISYSVAQGVTQTSFAVPFEFFDDSDVNVYVDGVLKTITTDYTISGGGGSTGTVTISVTGGTGGSVVVLTRDITIERTTDFTAGADINRAALNTQLDTLTAIAADVKDRASLALSYNDQTVGVTTELPNVATLKGKTLAFNASTGAPEAGPTIGEVSNAQTYATNAATSATAAATSASNASSSATAAASSATNAASSATAAAASATAAAASETAAETAEANTLAIYGSTQDVADAVAAASASETAAAASETAAAASETAAAASETAAATSETNAANSATAAASSASAASTSATNAATSATNAANSATAAAASQTAAAASAAAAANSYDLFDDRYLGSKTSDPTLDNDGNALVAGALYFNSTANEMRVYDGANWIAATSAGNVSLLEYNYTATNGQTIFSGADDNAATMSYTQQNLIVTLNGVVLENGTDYTANDGTSIVLASGAATGDELNVVAFKSFTTADMVPASTGGTFSGAVTVTGAFTSLGIDDNATSTAMTLDSSGNLLVGRSVFNNGAAGIDLAADGFLQPIRSSNIAARFVRLTSDGDIVHFRKDSTTVGSIGANGGRVYTAGPSYGAKFGNVSLDPCTNTGSTADNAYDLGGSSVRWKNLYLSGGVYLGGTGAANYLDDYEVGTWTIALASSGTQPTYNFTGTSGGGGSYIKVGSMVTVFFDRYVNITNAGTGSARITGLPFASDLNTSNGGYSAVQFRNATAFGSSSYVTGYINASTIYVELNNGTTGSNASWTTGTDIRFTGFVTYRTAA